MRPDIKILSGIEHCNYLSVIALQSVSIYIVLDPDVVKKIKEQFSRLREKYE